MNNVTSRSFLPTAALLIAASLIPSPARADCTVPAAVEGTLEYFPAEDIFKYCDGTDWIGWGDGGSGATPAGANTQIQFNSSGAFGATDALRWDGSYFYVNAPGDTTKSMFLGIIGGGAAFGSNNGWPIYIYAGGPASIGLYDNQGMALGGGYFSTTPPDDGLIVEGSVGIGTNDPESPLHVPDGKYAQFQDNNAGAPPAGDCDNNAERGRLSIDTTNNRLYVCNGATRGWDYVALTN